ncbi:MAG: hypothetical protein II931_05555 [Clostridia bacterium]|nr:hypothetical protein [Clostridia bacterium]
MNTDERITEMYAGVFDEIHASDELLRKVSNMTETTKKKSIRTAVKVAYAAAAAAVVLVAGNVIAYASTGEMLLKVLINGEEQTVSATQEQDGSYSFTCSDEDGYSYNVLVDGEIGDLDGDPSFEVYSFAPELVKEDGKTYIAIDEDFRADITAGLKEDGTAEGEFEYNGIKYCYIVDSDENIWLSGTSEDLPDDSGLEVTTSVSTDFDEAEIKIFDNK